MREDTLFRYTGSYLLVFSQVRDLPLMCFADIVNQLHVVSFNDFGIESLLVSTQQNDSKPDVGVHFPT